MSSSLKKELLTCASILSLLLLFVVVVTSSASADTITVDDDGNGDHTKIQDAINASQDGDTIRVWEGTYYENVEVNTRISLIGNGSANTIIDGGRKNNSISITANYVNISRFRIINSKEEYDDHNAGIKIFSNHNRIFDNEVNKNYNGIWLWEGEYTTIFNNTISNNSFHGINNRYKSDYTEIHHNIIFGSTQSGVLVVEADSVKIYNNSFYENEVGITIASSDSCSIYNNTITSNKGIRLLIADNLIIENNLIFSDDDWGMSIDKTHGCKINNNTITESEKGVIVTGSSSGIRFQYNNIAGNGDRSIDASNNNGKEVNATNNWWGDESGPYHGDNNPDGQGDEVTDDVLFEPWSVNGFYEKPIATIISISPNPASEFDVIQFEGSGEEPDEYMYIINSSWSSDIDGSVSSEFIYSSSDLSTGYHHIFFKVRNNLGIWSNEVNMTVEVRPRPIAVIDNITPNPALEFASVSFNGDSIGGPIEEYSWRSDKDDFLSSDKDFITSTLSWGIHTIYFKVRDDLDAMSEEISTKITIHRPPTAEIKSITPNVVLEGHEIIFICVGFDDTSVVKYVWESSIDGEIYNGTETIFSLSDLPLGNHTITFKVQDEYGAWSAPVSSYVIVNGPPTAVIDSILPNATNENAVVDFIGHGEDEGVIHEYAWRSTIDGFLTDEATFTLTNLSNGTHSIFFKVMDEHGVWSEEVFKDVAVNGIPRAHITSINPVLADNGEIATFVGSGTDDDIITGYSWRSDIDGLISEEQTFSLSNLSNGTHTIFLKITDANGAWSDEVSAELTINGIPIAMIESVSKDPAVEGESITLVGNGTDDNDVVAFIWLSDIDGEIYNGTENSFSTSNLSIATHTIYLRVVDDQGSWSEQVSTTIIIEQKPEDTAPPTVTITAPDSGSTVKGNVTFYGTASDNVNVLKAEFRFAGADEWSQTKGTTDWSFSLDTTQLEDGEYSVEFRSFDGTQYSEIATLTFRVDNIEDEDSGDSDEFFLMKQIGPLPLVGYLGIIVGLVVIGMAASKKKSKKKDSKDTQSSTATPVAPVPASLTLPSTTTPPSPAAYPPQAQQQFTQQFPQQQSAQYPPQPQVQQQQQSVQYPQQSQAQQLYARPAPTQQPYVQPSPTQESAPLQSIQEQPAPPQSQQQQTTSQYPEIPSTTTTSSTPTTWHCPTCGKEVEAKFSFCVNCGYKKAR